MGAMDEDTSKLYLQNLEEYVLDEGKIVTYKWLSRELNLHVNFAKQLLHTFLKQHKKDVHATYLLSGLLKDEVTHKVLIVQEDGLEKAKSQFKTLSSEHVYSVQKAKQIADLSSLYIIDRYNKDHNDIKRLNAIRCNETVERAADEIARLKIKARAASVTTDEKAWPTAKKKVTTETNKETETAATTSEEKLENKKQETVKKKEVKSGGIAAMFAAQSSKNQKQETINEKNKANGKPAPKAKGGIAMFFNRNTEKPKENKPPPPPVVKDDNNDSGFDSKDSQPITDDEDEHKQHESDETKTSKSKTGTKGKSKTEPVQKEKKTTNVKHSTGKTRNKRKASDDTPSSKKRKRIVCISDSEDSDNDIFGKDEEDEDEAPNSPLPVPEPVPAPLVESDEEVIPPTQQGEKKPGRKRERKLKVSTFMDEDGYVVTKREYVVESCTDSESEEKKENMKAKDNSNGKLKNEKKSPTSEPPTKKKCSPQKVKQATLMNFFKKK